MDLLECTERFVRFLPKWFWEYAKITPENSIFADPKTDTVYFHLFTDVNEYVISIHSGEAEPSVTCNVLSRKPRAGETQRRGREVLSGPLNTRTLNDIFIAIVAFECVRIHRPVSSLHEEAEADFDSGPTQP